MGINNLVQSVEITISGPFGTFLSYLYLFIIGSFIGWIGEVIFRRFFSMKRWINPGFLKGPCLPLYGFGVCILHFFTTIFLYFLNDSITLPSYYSNFIEPKGTLPFYLTSLIFIIVVGISLTLLEYIAGIIFVKGLRIKLRDYSKLKGNLQGLICPLFSAIWVLVAVIYWFLIGPFIFDFLEFLNSHLWVLTFFIGGYYSLLLLDFIKSVMLSIKLRGQAKELKVVVDFERFKLSIKNNAENEKAKDFINSIKESAKPIKEKFSEMATNVKRHMYINNEIPSETAADVDETPRTVLKKMNDKED